MRDHFPGSELVFDSYSPIRLRVHNFQLTTLGHKASAHWGIRHGQESERGGNGIRLLGEWDFCDEPEPRLAPIRSIRLIDTLLGTLRIYDFQLGKAAG